MLFDVIYRGPALRIAVGIMMLVLMMAGGAGATKFIRNDATGGDCTSFGTWTLATKTCTMTSDLIETIQIDSNGTTLDGNGHQTAGNGRTGNGIYLSGRSGVTIKNLHVGQFNAGFYLLNSNNNYLIDNTASNNHDGIVLSDSISNMLRGNIANSNSYYGIYLSSANINTLLCNSNNLSGNIANSNGQYGINLRYSNNNTLSGNTANLNVYGIVVDHSNINKLTGNIANLNNGDGIDLSPFSSNNRLSSNIANLNKGHGISIYTYSNSNTLKGNNASLNKGDGIYLGTDSNTVSGNIVSSNSVNGLYLSGSINNIYNNSFNNTINLVIQAGSNTWNTAKTSGKNIVGGPYLGGNFWAYPNGTGFSQKCADANKDGICDAQYTLDTNNIDYLPLAKNTATATIVTVISPNGGEILPRGSTQTIRWNYTGSPGSFVNITLLKRGIFNRTIISSTPIGSNGSGSYNWLINPAQALGTDYKVRVTSTTNSAYTDTSNNNFTISVLISCNTSTIYGYSFNDTNGNKIKDSGEAGLLNRTIFLKGYDTCTRTLVGKIITTNTTGYYAFKGINQGSYVLSQDYVLGWLPTTDAAYTLSIPSVSVSVRKDFGNKKFI